MEWELEVTSNPHQLAWNISLLNDSLPRGETFQVELELDSSSLPASAQELVTTFMLRSTSPEYTPHPQSRSIAFVVRTVVSATPSALHSLVVIDDAASLTAGESLEFHLTLKDAEGMTIKDMADVLIDAELTHNSSGTGSTCSASYDQSDHRFLGRCDLPRSSDGAGVPLAGEFSLPVKLGASNEMIGNSSTAQDVLVRRCPVGWYLDDASGRATSGECISCESLPKASAACDSAGNSLSSLHVTENHWRTGTDSADIRPCVAHEPLLCIGSQNYGNDDDDGTNSNLCRNGHTGAYCSLCMENYFLDNRGVCDTCGSDGAVAGTLTGFGALLVVGVVTFVYFMVSGRLVCGPIYDRVRGRRAANDDDGRRSSEARMAATSETRGQVLQVTSVTKMVIKFGQIMSQLGPTCVHPRARCLCMFGFVFFFYSHDRHHFSAGTRSHGPPRLPSLCVGFEVSYHWTWCHLSRWRALSLASTSLLGSVSSCSVSS